MRPRYYNTVRFENICAAESHLSRKYLLSVSTGTMCGTGVYTDNQYVHTHTDTHQDLHTLTHLTAKTHAKIKTRSNCHHSSQHFAENARQLSTFLLYCIWGKNRDTNKWQWGIITLVDEGGEPILYRARERQTHFLLSYTWPQTRQLGLFVSCGFIIAQRMPAFRKLQNIKSTRPCSIFSAYHSNGEQTPMISITLKSECLLKPATHAHPDERSTQGAH